MLRRRFIQSLTAIIGLPLFPLAKEEVQEDLPEYDVAVMTIKRNGIIYKLGFELTNIKEKDEKGLGFLQVAALHTIYPPIVRKPFR